MKKRKTSKKNVSNRIFGGTRGLNTKKKQSKSEKIKEKHRREATEELMEVAIEVAMPEKAHHIKKAIHASKKLVKNL